MFGLLKRVVAPLAAIALGFMASTAARAATVPIVGFVPTDTNPVIVLDAAGNLTTGAGATQLQFTVSNPALRVAAGLVPPGNIFPGSLSLSGFSELGVAVPNGIGSYEQKLTTGRFTIATTAAVGSLPAGTLLTGSVSNASIMTNTVTGTVLSGKFNYDGGSLFALFPSVGLYNPGEFSITLTAIAPPVLLPEANGTLPAFSSSATGNFSAETVPLPATAWMGLVLIGGVGGARGVSMLRRRNALMAA
jgi:hypothetical protein